MTDCEPHGDGLLALEYIRRLALRGHELHVAVPLMSIKNLLPDTVHLHPVPSWSAVSQVNPSAINRLEYAVRVRHLLRRLQTLVQFDLIHQLNPVVPGVGLFLSGCGLPIVLGPLPAPGTGTLPAGVGTTLKLLALHRQIRSAAAILVPSLASLTLLPKDPETRSKVRELHYGIDTKVFCPAEPPVAEGCSILFLANLVRRKGALLLLEAFELVAAQHSECILLIAGSGPEEQSLRERSSRSKVAHRIRFLGNIPREQVPSVLNNATVYCLPSYSEPFGMTALEAMACGRPVIGTNVSGLGYLLPDAAFVVEPGDRVGLASVLHRLLSSEDLRQTTGTLNRATAVNEYDWDRVIDRLEVLYSEVLA